MYLPVLIEILQKAWFEKWKSDYGLNIKLVE